MPDQPSEAPVLPTEDLNDIVDQKETHKEKKKRLESEADAALIATDDHREHVNIVFIGHVDAGKSTLSGQVLLSSGMVDQRSFEKLTQEATERKKENMNLAGIMDTNEEERTHGITVEVGRGHFFTEKRRYTILDAPGHSCYVPNMLCGLAQTDVGILVISARRGEFESGFAHNGQTREHAVLAKTIGVKKLLVPINKMDDITVNWSQERYNEVVGQLSQFLRSIGFNLKNDVTFLPVSGRSAANVKVPLSKDDCPWFNGSSLLDSLDALPTPERMKDVPLRIPVLDKYREEGKTYILGKVETGILKTGDLIVSNPGNVSFTVLQIRTEANILTVAPAGENVKVVVKCSQGEEDQLVRGSVLSIPSSLCPVTTDIVVQLSIIFLHPTKPIFAAGYEGLMHLGVSTVEVRVVRLLDELDTKTGQSIKKLPVFVKEKKVVIVHLALGRPLCVEKFADFASLGRFILREEGYTVGWGKVLATSAPIRKKK